MGNLSMSSERKSKTKRNHSEPNKSKRTHYNHNDCHHNNWPQSHSYKGVGRNYFEDTAITGNENLQFKRQLEKEDKQRRRIKKWKEKYPHHGKSEKQLLKDEHERIQQEKRWAYKPLNNDSNTNRIASYVSGPLASVYKRVFLRNKRREWVRREERVLMNKRYYRNTYNSTFSDGDKDCYSLSESEGDLDLDLDEEDMKNLQLQVVNGILTTPIPAAAARIPPISNSKSDPTTETTSPSPSRPTSPANQGQRYSVGLDKLLLNNRPSASEMAIPMTGSKIDKSFVSGGTGTHKT